MHWAIDKRIEEVSAWATSRGFTFTIADPEDELYTLPLDFLRPLMRSFWNVVRGEWNGVQVRAFDLATGKTTDAYSMSTCAVTRLERDVPHLFVTHRALSDVVSDILVPRIKMELGDFNDEWEIRCGDHGFASAVIHQRMMDWLGKQGETPPRTSFELNFSR